jgi:hypothetical protein
MPNDCVNRITIYADAATIEKIKAVDYKVIDLVPALDPSANAVDTWGTDRFYYYELIAAGPEAIAFSICTAWAPPIGFLTQLVNANPEITFLKSDWHLEDGPAGIFVAERGPEMPLSIQSMTWDEGCLEERAQRFGPRLTSLG